MVVRMEVVGTSGGVEVDYWSSGVLEYWWGSSGVLEYYSVFLLASWWSGSGVLGWWGHPSQSKEGAGQGG